MNKVSLVLRIFAIGGGLTAGAAWFMTQGKLDDMQQQLTNTQNSLNSTRADLASAEDKIISLEGDLKTTRTELAESKRTATQVQNQYFEATREITRLQDNLEDLENANRRLTSDNRNLKDEILAVKSAPPPDIDNSEVVLGYKSKIDDLEREIQELQARLSGAPTTFNIAGNSNIPSSAFQVSATVAAIEPAAGMIVFNRGLDAGLQRMSEYSLHKNGNELGKIRVTAIEPGASVGAILVGSSILNDLRTGDNIVIVQ